MLKRVSGFMGSPLRILLISVSAALRLLRSSLVCKKRANEQNMNKQRLVVNNAQFIADIR